MQGFGLIFFVFIIWYITRPWQLRRIQKRREMRYNREQAIKVAEIERDWTQRRQAYPQEVYTKAINGEPIYAGTALPGATLMTVAQLEEVLKAKPSQ